MVGCFVGVCNKRVNQGEMVESRERASSAAALSAYQTQSERTDLDILGWSVKGARSIRVEYM